MSRKKAEKVTKTTGENNGGRDWETKKPWKKGRKSPKDSLEKINEVRAGSSEKAEITADKAGKKWKEMARRVSRKKQK